MPNMPKSSSRSPRNFFTDLVRSATSIVRPASTPPASAFSRSHAPLPTGSNAHPPTTLDPSLDLRRIAFHEEPYTLSPLEGPYGYFPMRLGQKLRRGTCEIVRKLGYGTNSSVWLAKETTPDGHRYIVLKIMSVYATEVEIRRLCYEGAVAHDMTALGKPDQAHPGYRHCAIIGRTFFEHSAHGEHLCSLLFPYGTSLDDLLETSPTGRLPLSAVKTITRQVLLGLSFLEDKFQRVHTDVKSANILHHPRASTEQIDRFLADNPPQMYEDTPPVNPRISPEPIPALRSQPLPNFGLDPSYANISIKLIDYDSAIRAKDIRADTPICTPTELRAPEMLLGHAWSYPVEVWAVGCLIFYLLTHETVFPTDTEDLLPFIYDYLGPFPEDFVRRCTKGRKCIDRNGIPLGAKGKDGGQGSLESRFATLCDGLSAQDIGDTCRFLRKCLAIDPLARPTVSQLLQDAWLKI
ncbi:kinase-like protein [Trametes versicolor FP-101664 SS1]|uniref:kinase-like protein n=1 Tax=Trametes versicolor (strain FP-101664) TaxID=717944 RepID=UPI00046217E2|nr:kinase-like protein [Trametes versicolor FP-101664 SS1]EIW52769.1 kinase-like protein [Trametes versicolor FP-101664 SS1]